MKSVILIFLFLLFSGCIKLTAQEFSNQEEQSVIKVFELFFKSMHDRDTVTLRKIIRSASGVFFMSSKNETSDMTIKGGGGGSLKGFIKSVGNPDGLYGMCHNKLQDYELYLYEGIALVSTKYTCYTTKDKIENCGRYIIQFMKFRNENVEEGYEWRITKVDRIIFDNEKCIQ